MINKLRTQTPLSLTRCLLTKLIFFFFHLKESFCKFLLANLRHIWTPNNKAQVSFQLPLRIAASLKSNTRTLNFNSELNSNLVKEIWNVQPFVGRLTSIPRSGSLGNKIAASLNRGHTLYSVLFGKDIKENSSPLCWESHRISIKVVNVILSSPLLHCIHTERLGIQESIDNICRKMVRRCILIDLINFFKLNLINLIKGKPPVFLFFSFMHIHDILAVFSVWGLH